MKNITIKNSFAAEQLAVRIAADFISKKYAPGEIVPTVRELAAIYDAPQNVVIGAVELLRDKQFDIYNTNYFKVLTVITEPCGTHKRKQFAKNANAAIIYYFNWLMEQKRRFKDALISIGISEEKADMLAMPADFFSEFLAEMQELERQDKIYSGLADKIFMLSGEDRPGQKEMQEFLSDKMYSEDEKDMVSELKVFSLVKELLSAKEKADLLSPKEKAEIKQALHEIIDSL